MHESGKPAAFPHGEVAPRAHKSGGLNTAPFSYLTRSVIAFIDRFAQRAQTRLTMSLPTR